MTHINLRASAPLDENVLSNQKDYSGKSSEEWIET
jgi:hypothetical protein